MSDNQRDLQAAYDLLWRVRRREGLTKDGLSFVEQQKRGVSLEGIRAVLAMAAFLGIELRDQYDNVEVEVK